MASGFADEVLYSTSSQADDITDGGDDEVFVISPGKHRVSLISLSVSSYVSIYGRNFSHMKDTWTLSTNARNRM